MNAASGGDDWITDGAVAAGAGAVYVEVERGVHAGLGVAWCKQEESDNNEHDFHNE